MAKRVKKQKQKLAKSLGELALSVDWRGQRRKALRKSMNAATNAGDMQTARSLSYELAREEMIRVRKGASAVLARAGLNDQDQAKAILGAAGPTIRNAQRSFDRGAGRSQRQVLRDIYRGDYVAENPDVDATQLESQSRIVDAERALRKARTPEAREAAAYQLTRWQLIDGHRRGEI